MECTKIRAADIETASRFGIDRCHVAAYTEVAQQSGLPLATVCRDLGAAVQLIELRRGPRVDVRQRIRDLRRRKHPELEPQPERTGPIYHYVPTCAYR